MEKYINDYLMSLYGDNKSAHTIKNYGGDLFQFNSSMSKSVQEIDYADLRMWVNSLAKSNLTAATRARKISAVKSFFKYLRQMNVISSNPAECLTFPKQEKKVVQVISEIDASEILKHARNDGKRNILYMRDLSIICTFLYTGIRREELTNIKVADVDLTNGTILIHGKGNKQRIVYCNSELIAILSEYIIAHRKRISTAENSEYLFVSAKTGKISVNAVNDIVNKFMEKAGCKEKGLSCHQLRKRMATTAYKNTHDLLTVQRILGHSNPTVTQRYIAGDAEAMKNAAKTISF